jgi:RHS repeat-associated protein
MIREIANDKKLVILFGFRWSRVVAKNTCGADPDLGYWTYGYDVLGNLTSQTDASSCNTAITYDDLNRPTQKTYTGSGACGTTPQVTYTYDSNVGGNEGSGSTTWFYNVLGEVTNETHTIESTNYSIATTYDAFSRPLSQTVPSNGGTENLSYTYNSMGALLRLTGTKTYVSQIHYNASRQVTDQLLGNNLYQQSCYDSNTLRISNMRTYPGSLQGCVVTNPANALLNLAYTYQSNGNISQIVDSVHSETVNYAYDDFDRLLSTSGAYSQSYSYNTIGNMTAKNGATYTYGDTTHKHAVTSLSTGDTYTYDANGNMTQRVEAGVTTTQTFDAENRMASGTTGGLTGQFVYDGDGNMVKKINPDGSRTLYIAGVYEVNKSSGGSVTSTKTYYPAGGAMRDSSTLYYILKDHLGSTGILSNSGGGVVADQRYYPFGETRVVTGSMYTDRLFTGQREMTGSGIYYYGARFYSPKLGRFLSADTMVPSYTNPQAFNRYSYVLNNPIRYNDPSGHRNCEEDDYDCDKADLEKIRLAYDITSKYKNVKIKNITSWDMADLKSILTGLNAIMGKNGFNGDMDAFNKVFGKVTFSLQGFPGKKAGDAVWETGDIRLDPAKANWTTVIHEMGHILDGTLKRRNDHLFLYSDTYGNVFDAGRGATKYARDEGDSLEDFADSFLAVIRYGTSNNPAIWENRVQVMTALIQSYTNSDHTLSPGR